MAIRTTEALVRGIIRVNPNIVLTPFIATANSITNFVATRDSSGLLSAETLELIERWISAHVYSNRHQLYASKVTGRSSAVFQWKTDMYLEGTTYGQTAIMLDVTGTLAGLGKKKVSIDWLGIPDSEEVAGA